jgi:DNA-binding NarL/FixJ family response regulator
MVKVHISNIFSRLGVASPAEAISLATQNKPVR